MTEIDFDFDCATSQVKYLWKMLDCTGLFWGGRLLQTDGGNLA